MSNLQIVTDFIDAWNRRDAAHIVAAFTPDAVYHNIPMPVMTGIEAIRAFVEPFVGSCESIEWETLTIAESATGAVLTERVDAFVTSGKRLKVRVMGVFELKDGKISAWRDYFDMKEFTDQQ
jgi:limonene-1,2-epoxide hydrolase